MAQQKQIGTDLAPLKVHIEQTAEHYDLAPASRLTEISLPGRPSIRRFSLTQRLQVRYEDGTTAPLICKTIRESSRVTFANGIASGEHCDKAKREFASHHAIEEQFQRHRPEFAVPRCHKFDEVTTTIIMDELTGTALDQFVNADAACRKAYCDAGRWLRLLHRQPLAEPKPWDSATHSTH